MRFTEGMMFLQEYDLSCLVAMDSMHARSTGAPWLGTTAEPAGLRFALILVLTILALPLRAQDRPHEYRPEVVVTLPEWRGAAIALVEEQHLGTNDLEPVERQQGVMLTAPRFGLGTLSFDVRQVVTGSGVEHRYIPALTVVSSFRQRWQLRSRARVEVRDIAGTWSRRYQDRVTVSRGIVAGGRDFQPYAQGSLSYDSRYSAVNRNEVALGIRVPMTSGVSIDPYLMRQADNRRAVRVVMAAGLTLRVSL